MGTLLHVEALWVPKPQVHSGLHVPETAVGHELPGFLGLSLQVGVQWVEEQWRRYPHLPLVLEFPLAAGDALPGVQQVLHPTADPLAQLLLFLPGQLRVVALGPPGNGIEDEVQFVAVLRDGGCPRRCRQLPVSQAGERHGDRSDAPVDGPR